MKARYRLKSQSDYREIYNVERYWIDGDGKYFCIKSTTHVHYFPTEEIEYIEMKLE